MSPFRIEGSRTPSCEDSIWRPDVSLVNGPKAGGVIGIADGPIL